MKKVSSDVLMVASLGRLSVEALLPFPLAADCIWRSVLGSGRVKDCSDGCWSFGSLRRDAYGARLPNLWFLGAHKAPDL